MFYALIKFGQKVKLLQQIDTRYAIHVVGKYPRHVSAVKRYSINGYLQLVTFTVIKFHFVC